MSDAAAYTAPKRPGYDPWDVSTWTPEESQAFARRANQIPLEIARKEFERDAALSALLQPDPDFHALQICVDFHLVRLGVDDDEPDDEAENSEETIAEINSYLEPLVSHYTNAGFIRADRLQSHLTDGLERDNAIPTFYLIYRSEAEALVPATLGNFSDQDIPISAPSQYTMRMRGVARPVNATRVFAALRGCSGSISQWGGQETPDFLPQSGESRQAWCERVAVNEQTTARMVERWEASGRDTVIYAAYGGTSERALGAEEIPWLVDGVLARACLTVLAGSGGSGKSSLAQEWLSSVCGVEVSRPRTVLGQSVNGRFFGALVFTEDSYGVINNRSKKHEDLWGSGRFAALDGSSGKLTDLLDRLRKMPFLDLVVIDNLRTLMDGREESSDEVNEFCRPIELFARETNAAVVVLHHFTKEPCRSLSGARGRVRGSGAIVDRARMVIGIVQRGDGAIEVGAIKHNFPEDQVWLPTNRGALYRRDLETFTLLPIHELAQVPTPASSSDDAGAIATRVLATIERFNRDSRNIHRSGKSGLFEVRPPELAGCSRQGILSVVSALQASGQITNGDRGLRVATRPDEEDATAAIDSVGK